MRVADVPYAALRLVRRPLEGAAGPPDFIGVGMPRVSAGGWWMDLLTQHPQIRPPRERRLGLSFFDPFGVAPMQESDVAAYHAQFARAPGTICGEWSGGYACQPWTPPLLARAAPGAKLLLMVADPFDAYSAMFAEWLARHERGDKRVYINTPLERVSYATHLARLLRFFPRERILVLQWEQCRRDPEGEFARTLRFLRVADDVRPRQLAWTTRSDHARLDAALRTVRIPDQRIARWLGRPMGATREVTVWPDLAQALHDALDPEVTALAEQVPDLDLSLWRNFAHLASSARTTPASAGVPAGSS